MAYEGDLQKYAPVEVDEVGMLILAARDLLSDPAKWCQNHYQSKGAVCILGAFGFKRMSSRTKKSAAVQRLSQHIPLTFHEEMYGCDAPDVRVAAFNDASEHSEVLALLDRAAKPGAGS